MHFLVNSFTFNWILMVERNSDSWESVHGYSVLGRHQTYINAYVCIIRLILAHTHICMPHTKSAHHETKGVEQWQGTTIRENKWSIVLPCKKAYPNGSTSNEFNWTRHTAHNYTHTHNFTHTLIRFDIWNCSEEKRGRKTVNNCLTAHMFSNCNMYIAQVDRTSEWNEKRQIVWPLNTKLRLRQTELNANHIKTKQTQTSKHTCAVQCVQIDFVFFCGCCCCSMREGEGHRTSKKRRLPHMHT